MSSRNWPRIEGIEESLRIFLKKHRGTINTFCITTILISGTLRIVNDPSVDTVQQFFSSLLERRLFFSLFVGSIIALIIVNLLILALDNRNRRKGYESKLADLINSRVDPVASPFAKGVISWGASISMEVTHDLREGWPLAEINVRYDGTDFELPVEHRQAYESYLTSQYDSKRFFDDNDKFMLVQNPKSFKHSSTLVLEIQKTKYSHIQYYRDNIAKIQAERNALISEGLEGKIRFPHALCMQVIIITDDNKILLTHRSQKVDYFPKTWASSLEEQMSPSDLISGNSGSVFRWGKRLLIDELGLYENEYSENNLRALSVFLETDILNCSLSCVSRLNISSSELDNALRTRHRAENEFTDWTFLSYPELVSELKQPSRIYHPTSGYRMLVASVKHYGMPRLMRLLVDQ